MPARVLARLDGGGGGGGGIREGAFFFRASVFPFPFPLVGIWRRRVQEIVGKGGKEML